MVQPMPAANRPTRRDFLHTGAALGAALSCAPLWADEQKPAEKKRFKKAVKIGMVRTGGSLADKMKTLKELGFDGVELNSPGGPSPEEVAQAKEASGLEVHGVVDSVHWEKRLSDPNPEVRAAGLDALKTALRASKAYGGTSVLLVPGRVTADATYEQTWERSLAEVKKAIPLAEELGIHILLENVWNDFLTDPKETARYIDECGSPMVGAYFDVGNAVRYSPPHEWVPILGKRIVKLDIKEYDLTKGKKEGLGSGFNVELLEGECNWPRVMDALRAIGFAGWGTAEIPGGDRQRLAEIAKRMDRIFAS